MCGSPLGYGSISSTYEDSPGASLGTSHVRSSAHTACHRGSISLGSYLYSAIVRSVGSRPMELSPRQRRSLAAICDTFAPGADGVPSASALGVPDSIARALDANPREAERKQLALLLGAFDSRPLTALGRGGFKRFSELPLADREAVLRSWADSRVPQQRGIFHALRRAALVHYYGLPAPGGGPSPVWDAID